MANGHWPSIGVVIPTRERPQQLRRALSTILAQDYPGRLVALVVFDGVPPDRSLERRHVLVTPNTRTPGLAGARNTGILDLDTELVAFCDDDDEWLPGKLDAQVRSLVGGSADFVSTSVAFVYDGSTTVRLAGTSEVVYEQLLRSRMAMLHSSTFVIRRDSLLHEIGLVNEAIPGSQNEDWDLLLRAASLRPIAHVDVPLVRVSWSRGSHFGRRWDTKIASLAWMLEHHPRIRADRRAAARVYGQIAFAHAALGERRTALSWCARALATRPLEPRAYIAGAVACGLATGDSILDVLHQHGHGI